MFCQGPSAFRPRKRRQLMISGRIAPDFKRSIPKSGQNRILRTVEKNLSSCSRQQSTIMKLSTMTSFFFGTRGQAKGKVFFLIVKATTQTSFCGFCRTIKSRGIIFTHSAGQKYRIERSSTDNGLIIEIAQSADLVLTQLRC